MSDCETYDIPPRAPESPDALGTFLIGLRRHLHAYPELAYREERTSAIVAKLLDEFGYQVRRGLARTGVVGELRWTEERGVIITADMDALEIEEENNVPYASRCRGACMRVGTMGTSPPLLVLLGFFPIWMCRSAWCFALLRKE